MMKSCLFLFLSLLTDVHAFHDAHDTSGGLYTRELSGLASFKVRDLDFAYLGLKPRAALEPSSRLTKRGPCMSKGCLGTRPSSSEQRQRQTQQGQLPQDNSQQRQPQQVQRQQAQPPGQPSSGRLSRQNSDSSIGAPSVHSSSAASWRSHISGDNIRWGSLVRNSPSWDARRPARASSHAAQQFTNSLRNQYSSQSNSAHNSGTIPIASGTGGQGAAMASSSSRSHDSGQGVNSGASSLNRIPSGGTEPPQPRTPRSR